MYITMPGYLGNKSDMTVHHLALMKPECKIYDVKKKDSVYFVPDLPGRQKERDSARAYTALANQDQSKSFKLDEVTS